MCWALQALALNSGEAEPQGAAPDERLLEEAAQVMSLAALIRCASSQSR